MLSIKCLRSKKSNNLFCVLVFTRYDENSYSTSDVFVSFDVPTIARVWGKTVRDVYLLEEGDVINIL